MLKLTPATAFEASVLPHLDAAYNLARWLLRNEHDAEDAVQEAYLRAFRFYATFRGSDSRPWLLKIVRNTCYTWLKQHHMDSPIVDQDLRVIESADPGPETLLLQASDSRRLKDALEELPSEFREALVLRDLEGLAYKEIADVTGVPMGTVMSRLARGRKRLLAILTQTAGTEAGKEL